MDQHILLKELTRIAKEYGRHHPWSGIHTICEAAIEEINRLTTAYDRGYNTGLCVAEELVRDGCSNSCDTEVLVDGLEASKKIIPENDESEQIYPSEKDRSEQIPPSEEDSSSKMERLIEENDLGWETVRLQAKELNRLRNESTTYEIPANIRVLREMHDETIKELRDEIELLEAECDGYRRQICRLESVRPEGGWGDTTSGTTPEAIAKKYGWDCYEKE